MSASDDIAGARLPSTSTPRRRATMSMRTKRLQFHAQQLLIDGLALTIGLVAPAILLGTLWRPFTGVSAVVVFLPLYLLFCLYNEAFSLEVLRGPLEGARRAMMALMLTMAIVLLFAFFTQRAEAVSRLTFGIAGVASAVLVAMGRILFARRVQALTGGHLVHELLIVDRDGTFPPAQGWTVSAATLGLVPDVGDPHMLHRFGELAKSFDRVVIDCSADRRRAWAQMLKGADIDGELLVEHFNDLGAVAIAKFREADTLVVARRALSVPDRARKRTLDLLITIPTLLAMLPVIVLVAVAIKLDSPGPILFRQDRVGRGNRHFKVLKFRSMRTDATDGAGATSASRDDQRVTRVGRIIRRTSVDELPQLLNVLLGDMSLVGPRPHALGSLAGERLFWEIDETYWHRHRLKPGITGLAQVRGFRGATPLQQDLINRLQADLEYIEGWSIWRDVSILFATVRVVVHKNAY